MCPAAPSSLEQSPSCRSCGNCDSLEPGLVMGDLTSYQTQTQSDAALRDLFFHHKLPCPGHNHPHPTPCPPGDGPQLCAVAESTSIVFCMTPPAAVPPGALGWNDSQLTSLDQDHPPSCSSGVCFPRPGASFL